MRRTIVYDSLCELEPQLCNISITVQFQDDGLDEQAHESLLAVDNWKRFYKNRDRWESRVDFDVATLAAGIGLGNIWKLALVLFENGKGELKIQHMNIST